MPVHLSNTVLCYAVGMGLLVQYLAVLFVYSPTTDLGVRTADLLEPTVATKKATFGMA